MAPCAKLLEMSWVDMVFDARWEDMNAYLSAGIHTVNGWCIPQFRRPFGPSTEKSETALWRKSACSKASFSSVSARHFVVSSQDRVPAIDIFDMQQFNLDGAGVGKLDVVKRILIAHGIAEDAVCFVEADSLALMHRDADCLMSEIGQVHFSSIDGCHEVAHTVNGIEFAMPVSANHGIIAVDDYANPNWAGVQEALVRMYLTLDFRFIPLVVTCNKLLLASFSYHSAYLRTIEAYLRKAHPDTKMKHVKRFGCDSLTIQPSLQQWTEPFKSINIGAGGVKS